MDEATAVNPGGFKRFTKHIILGGLFGGLLSAIPFLGCLNCVFCLLNMAGIVFALQLYLKAHPEDTLTVGESVGFGAVAGAGAGLVSFIAKMMFTAMFGASMAALAGAFPDLANNEALSGMIAGGAASILFAPVTIILYSAFGLLGAFLGMKFFFKARLRKP